MPRPTHLAWQVMHAGDVKEEGPWGVCGRIQSPGCWATCAVRRSGPKEKGQGLTSGAAACICPQWSRVPQVH